MSVMWNCSICDKQCFCQEYFDNHIKGRQHKAELAKLQDSPVIETDQKVNQTDQWNCGICSKQCFCQEYFDSHLNGRQHKTELAKLQAGSSASIETSQQTEEPPIQTGLKRPALETLEEAPPTKRDCREPYFFYNLCFDLQNGNKLVIREISKDA